MKSMSIVYEVRNFFMINGVLKSLKIITVSRVKISVERNADLFVRIIEILSITIHCNREHAFTWFSPFSKEAYGAMKAVACRSMLFEDKRLRH